MNSTKGNECRSNKDIIGGEEAVLVVRLAHPLYLATNTDAVGGEGGATHCTCHNKQSLFVTQIDYNNIGRWID